MVRPKVNKDVNMVPINTVGGVPSTQFVTQLEKESIVIYTETPDEPE